MLYLLDKTTKTAKWNGVPLHETTSGIVTEEMNGEFSLVVKYPISDSDIYKQIKEDMLIKANVPVVGPQLFRVKKPVEHNDHLELTCRHITEDIMTRSIRPFGNQQLGCLAALTNMLEHSKTDLAPFSFDSDITSRHTFNTEKDETLYSVLLDGKHSIVGTWEGELERNNYTLTVKRSRGQNRGVIISSHFNLDEYQRECSTENIVTRIYATSTFKEEGREEDTVLKVTVDSPLINQHPYINEQEYENNNAKTVEELRQWAEAKFTNGHIDKLSDKIVVKAFLLDGQSVHIGDTVTLKSSKHDIDIERKCVGYEYDVLSEQYISLTFDDKVPVGSSGGTSGVSNLAETVISVGKTQSDIALDRAIANANRVFDEKFERSAEDLKTGIEVAKAKAEQTKSELEAKINAEIKPLANEAKQSADRANQSSTSQAQEMERLRTTLVDNKREVLAEANRLIADVRREAERSLSNVENTTNRRLSGLAAQFEMLKIGSANLFKLSGSVRERYKAPDGTDAQHKEYSYGQPIAITSQEHYILQAWTESRNTTSWVGYIFLDAAHAIVPGSYRSYYPGTIGYGKWDVVPPESAKYIQISFSNDAFGDNPNLKIQLEKGTIATDYHRADEDVDFKVSHLINQSQSTLSGEIAAVSQTLSETKRNLLDQANAQTELSSHVTTVEETANGTKTTVTELQKTVNATTGSLNAVSRRTKTVEDSLSGLTTRFENIRVGGQNLLPNADFSKIKETSNRYRVNNVDYVSKNLDGWEQIYNAGIENPTENYHAYINETFFDDGPVIEFNETNGSRNWKGIVVTIDKSSLSVGEYYFAADLFATGLGTRIWGGFYYFNKEGHMRFHSGAFDIEVQNQNEWLRLGSVLRLNNDIDLNKTVLFFIYGYGFSTNSILYMRKPKLEQGNIGTAFSLSQKDINAELATYKQTVDQNFVELTRTTQSVSDRVTEYKSASEQTAEHFRTSLNALEAFKNDEGARESRYLSLSREETARQLQTVRSDITRDYVSKSQLTETTRGIEQRFERLTTGRNLVKNSKIKESSNAYGFAHRSVELEAGKTYLFIARAKKTGGDGKSTRIFLHHPAWRYASKILAFERDVYEVKSLKFKAEESIEYKISAFWSPEGGDRSGTADVDWYMVVEGDIKPSDWLPHVDDASSELATYKNTVDSQLSELSSTINTNNSAFTTFKNSYERTAQGVTEKLTTFEAYRNDEHLRSNAYFEASKAETAKQLMAYRQEVLEGYVAKSTYEDTARSMTRRFEELNSSLEDKVSTSELYQTATELRGFISRLDGEVMKTNSFTVNENGIVLQSGRTFDGRTMATMITQDPENVSIIARLLRVNADMIVNGAITGRHIKANSLETGNFKGGSVTAEVLGAGAVTAEKMLVNQAMINKLMTDDLLARAITASELFATSVQAVDISAARVTSGILASRNGAMTINLDTAEVDFLQEATIRFHSSNNAVKRTKGESTAFIHFSDDSYGGVYAGFGVRGGYGGVNSAPSGKGTFAGVRVFRPNDSLDKIELYGDKIELRHSFSEAGSIYFDHLSVQGKTIDLGAVLIALANMWTHYRNMRQRWEHSSPDLNRDYNILAKISSAILQ